MIQPDDPLDDWATYMLAAATALLLVWMTVGCLKVVRDAKPGSCAQSETHLFVYCRELPIQHPEEKTP